MPWTTLTALTRTGRIKAVSLAAFVALSGLRIAISVMVPTTDAQACDITRKVYNRTDRNLYIEIWRQGTQQWTSPALKPGGAMALEYLTIGDEILVTGPAGQIAFPLAARLARDNEVWGIARFSDPKTRERCEKAGIHTRRTITLSVTAGSDVPAQQAVAFFADFACRLVTRCPGW